MDILNDHVFLNYAFLGSNLLDFILLCRFTFFGFLLFLRVEALDDDLKVVSVSMSEVSKKLVYSSVE